jgi:N-acyl homoserine lactone hydrolase
MKKILGLLLILIVAGIGALVWSFQPAVLPTTGEFAINVPVAQPPDGMKIGVLQTGTMLAKAGLAYRGGSFNDERSFAMAPVLIDHPQGALLIDSGFGSKVDEHVKTTPKMAQRLSKYTKGKPAVEQLRAAGFDLARLQGVLLTHAHWDHVSGVDDLRNVPVWVTQPERDLIKICDDRTVLICSFGELNYKLYDFPDQPYLGFEQSHDVFKDGSVVIVPAPGHTPGSVIIFVTPPGEKRYAFVGDLAWQKEGIDLPAERPWLPRFLLKEDRDQVRAALVHMHRLQKAVPNLVVVPAHDSRVFETLPRFGT